MVEINQRNQAGTIIHTRSVEGLLEAPDEGSAVCQPGQGILLCGNANFLFCPFEGRDITAHTHDDAGWRNTFAHLQPSSIAQALRRWFSLRIPMLLQTVPEPRSALRMRRSCVQDFSALDCIAQDALEGRADMHGRRRIRIELPVCRVAQQKPVILIERRQRHPAWFQ